MTILRTTKRIGISVLAAALVVGAVQVSAQPGKKGPRASLLSSTTCTLELNDGADLVITTTLTNKSSGNTIPELRDGSSIQGTYKEQGVPGNVSEELNDPAIIGSLPIDVNSQLVVEATYDLCELSDDVANARELNGTATMIYGISGGGGETRIIWNRCTDDPDTWDVNEGGIKVAEVIDDIIAACSALNQ
jgi:hypothetical protein